MPLPALKPRSRNVRSAIGWIPYVLEHMDLEWEDQFQDLDLKMKPSEYWRRQCYATYQGDPISVRLIDVLGEDNVMWRYDFPHPDGVWPDSQEFIAREMAGVDPAVQRKVLWENAAHLYGLPLEPAASAPACGPGRRLCRPPLAVMNATDPPAGRVRHSRYQRPCMTVNRLPTRMRLSAHEYESSRFRNAYGPAPRGTPYCGSYNANSPLG